jgi:hypothetical protein
MFATVMPLNFSPGGVLSARDLSLIRSAILLRVFVPSSWSVSSRIAKRASVYL